MAQVYDPSGQPLEVPDDQVQPLFMSGQVGFAPGSTHPVLDPRTGTVLDVPAEEMHDVLSKGYTYLGVSGDKKIQNEKDFGGPLGTAEAYVGKALNEATIGGFDALRHKVTGETQERIEAPREVNPVASGLGAATGLIGPALIGDEAGIVGKVLSAPTKAIAHLGEAVAPAATSALGKIGSSVLRGTAEGTAYGTVGAATEDLLNDTPITSQHLFHGGVSGGLTGGVLSGGIEAGLGIAHKVAPVAFEKAASALDRLAAKTAPETFDGRADARNLAGSVELANNRMNEANAAHVPAFNDLVEQNLGTKTTALPQVEQIANEELANLERPVLDANPALGAFTKHVDLAQAGEEAVRHELYNNVLPAKVDELLGPVNKADSLSRKFADQLGNDLGRPFVENSAYNHSTSVITKLGDNLVAARNDADRFNAFRQAKRELNEVLPAGRFSVEDDRAVKAIRQARDDINGYLHNDGVFGDMAKLQKLADTAYAGLANSRPEFMKQLLMLNRDKFRGDQGDIARSLLASADKTNKYVARIRSGLGDVPEQARGNVSKHVDRMSHFFDVAAHIADNGQYTQFVQDVRNAQQVFNNILPHGESAAALTKEAKALAKGPLSKLSSEDKKIANIYTQLKNSKNDAEAFKVAREHYDAIPPEPPLGTKKDPVPARTRELRNNLHDILTDKSVFGEMAEHFEAVDGATRAQERAAADLKQQFAGKGGKIAGEVSPAYVDAGKAQNYINAEAKEKGIADNRTAALAAFQKASKEALDAQTETYHMLGKRFVDGNELLGHVDAIEGNRAAGVANKKRQLALQGERPFHVPFIAHEGGLTSQVLRYMIKNGSGLVRGTGSEVISSVAKHAADGARTFSEGLDSFFAGKTAAALPTTLSKVVILTQPKKGESAAESMTRIEGDFHKVLQDPEGFEAAMAQSNPKLARFAPNVLKEMAASISRAAGVLTKNAPDPMAAKGFVPPPSGADVAKFQGQIAAAFMPLPTVLAGLKSGTLTKTQCQMIQTSHPDIWMKAQTQCAERYAKTPKVGYQQQLSLSVVLNQPLAPGLSNVPAHQQVFSAQTQQGQKPHLAHASPASAKMFKAEVTNMSLNHPMSKR